ncbi:hypothetical protein PA10_00073 [Pseudomonas phage pPa_SNUABM_DT01]|nr:hypothetical protein PA10_00073 [Pseudomonas phage pPa_SNUABM_DT01]
MKAQIDKRTLKFYIGAATTGEGPGKWTWPGRDLPFLYQREWNINSSCSIEPDLDTWKKYGCVVAFIYGQGLRLMKFDEFFTHFGEAEATEMLSKSRGTYLKESKDEILDTLGCPR